MKVTFKTVTGANFSLEVEGSTKVSICLPAAATGCARVKADTQDRERTEDVYTA